MVVGCSMHWVDWVDPGINRRRVVACWMLWADWLAEVERHLQVEVA